MNYGYIYYSKNKVNGKLYIGKVTSRQLFHKPSYKGSGTDLMKALKEYGSEKF